MKLEREKDNPAFKGKSWRQRMVLRNLAEERNPWIPRIRVLICLLCFLPPYILPAWLGFRVSSLELFAAYMVYSLPIFILFRALVITPRIRQALESDVKPSA